MKKYTLKHQNINPIILPGATIVWTAPEERTEHAFILPTDQIFHISIGRADDENPYIIADLRDGKLTLV